jgi:DNA-binding response OmpR family regulator
MARRLLIVDDEPAIRFAVTEYFTAYGFLIDSAEDLGAAQRLLGRHDYDAVIADLRLGERDEYGGLSVIDQAKAQAHHPCIVLLSADHSPAIVEEAKRRGASFALHKPIPLYELKGRISEFLAWRELCQADEEFKPGQFMPTLPGERGLN